MNSPASGVAAANGAARVEAGEERAKSAEPTSTQPAWGREERAEREAREVASPRRVVVEPREPEVDAGASAAVVPAVPVPEPATVSTNVAALAASVSSAPISAAAAVASAQIDDPWGKVLAAAGPNRRLRILLNDISLVSVENDVVVLAVSEALHGAARANEKELCGLLATAWERAVKLELRQEGGEAAAATPAATQAAINANLQAVQEHPLVKQAMELFGAKVVSVQARKNAAKQE
ncbi:MAG: hypothetical protein WC718_05885 [Phycisphaerales bacterium]|jgi:hypothetical protein